MAAGSSRPIAVGTGPLGVSPAARGDGGPVFTRGPAAPDGGPIPTVTVGTPSSVPDGKKLNDVGADSTAAQRISQVAAENAPLRIVYGRQMIGAQIVDILPYAGKLVVLIAWCHGPVQSIESVWVDSKQAGVEASVVSIGLTNYTGTQTTPDATLVAAYAAQSPAVTYTDALTGIAYTVLTLPPNVTTGFPNISAIVQGLKVYDPRDGTQTFGVPSTYKYSDNAALAIGDLQTNATYGAGGSADWTSVTATANACDALVGGTEKRRIIGLCMDQVQDINAWFEALRTYAGCFLARTAGNLTLIPDRPTTSTFALTEAPAAGSPGCRVRRITRRSKRDVPTVVAVRYTDTTVFPWRDAFAYAYATGVQAGTVPWKAREIALPGITRYSQALREATEQLNKLALNDLVAEVAGQDDHVVITVGDVGSVVANLGLTANVRVIGMNTEIGRPVFSVERYDPAVYSDSVVAAPSVVDTLLPNPSVLTAPTSLAIAETVYLERITSTTLAGGLIYQSRFDVSWTAPVLGFPVTYRVEVWDGATKIRDEQVSATNYSTPAVQQGKTYTIKVFSRNTIAESATSLNGSQTAQGKLLPPGPVPAVRGRELGGIAFLDWDPAPDIDVMRYEWRYFPNGVGTWGTATFIDRIDGLTARFQGLPVGTHRFYVRAIDSVGNYSTGDATVDVTITSDANAFIQSRTFSNPLIAGAELLTDGDFATSPGPWAGIGVSGVSISGGKLNFTASTGAAGQAGVVVIGRLYRWTITIDSISGGRIIVQVGSGGAFTNLTAPGTYVGTQFGAGDTTLYVSTGGTLTTAVVDNVSLVEVSNIAAIPMIEGVWVPRWMTSIWGDQWSVVEPSPLNSGGNAVDSYHAAATSKFQGEAWDLGTTITGDWTLTPNTQDDAGTATYALETSPDGSTWTAQPGLSWKGSTRFIRPNISTTGAMTIKAPPKISLAALSKNETGQVTTSASAATLVRLANNYSGAQDLQATAIQTSLPRLCVADRILLHPQSGLQMNYTLTVAAGGGNSFEYWTVYTGTPLPASRLISATDVMEYEVFIDPSCPTNAAAGGMEFTFDASLFGRNYGLSDGYGSMNGPTLLPVGVWTKRRIPMGAAAGRAILTVDIVNEADALGSYKVLYRNIRITDNAGTPVQQGAWVYQTPAVTGEPQSNLNDYSNGTLTTQVGPSNSFNLYCFSDAGAQQAQLVQWSFKGY